MPQKMMQKNILISYLKSAVFQLIAYSANTVYLSFDCWAKFLPRNSWAEWDHVVSDNGCST
jgi:hypothetical protein